MTAAATGSESRNQERGEPACGVDIYHPPSTLRCPDNWLAAGWREHACACAVLSLAYGAIFAIVGLLLVVGLTQVGRLRGSWCLRGWLHSDRVPCWPACA